MLELIKEILISAVSFFLAIDVRILEQCILLEASLVWKKPKEKEERPNTSHSRLLCGIKKRSIARHRLNFNGVSQESAVVKPSLTK